VGACERLPDRAEADEDADEIEFGFWIAAAEAVV
jgi:hypothetical protein